MTKLFTKRKMYIKKQRKLNIENQEKEKQTINIKTEKMCTHNGENFIYFPKIVHV